MGRKVIPLVLSSVLVLACTENPVAHDAADESLLTAAFSGNGVVHHVSVGGADLCEAAGLPTGCDANFSLVANEHADGTVTGQWQDTWKLGLEGGGNGAHVAVDCLNVVGNGAVIGGAVTHGGVPDFGVDFTGFRVLTAVMDNGTSAGDPPDQILFTIIVGPPDALPPPLKDPQLCQVLTPQQLADDAGGFFDLTHGQVKVR